MVENWIIIFRSTSLVIKRYLSQIYLQWLLNLNSSQNMPKFCISKWNVCVRFAGNAISTSSNTKKCMTLFIKWSHRRKVEKFKDNNVLTFIDFGFNRFFTMFKHCKIIFLIHEEIFHWLIFFVSVAWIHACTMYSDNLM